MLGIVIETTPFMPKHILMNSFGSLEDLQANLNSMEGLYLMMWALVIGLTLLMILRARKLQPLPLLPLCVFMLTLTLSLKLLQIWFGLHWMPQQTPYDFFYWKEQSLNESVLKPMTLVLGGLMFHSLLYAFSELRQASKGKLSASTRILFHGMLLLCLLCVMACWPLLDLFILEPARSASAFINQEGTYIYDAANPESGQALFRILFYEGDPPYGSW